MVAGCWLGGGWLVGRVVTAAGCVVAWAGSWLGGGWVVPGWWLAGALGWVVAWAGWWLGGWRLGGGRVVAWAVVAGGPGVEWAVAWAA